MKITKELIKWCIENNACKEGIEYLKEHIGDDVHTMPSEYRHWLMIRNKDCPVNLEGMTPYKKAGVMVSRKDCPVNLDGMDLNEKKWVVLARGIEQ